MRNCEILVNLVTEIHNWFNNLAPKNSVPVLYDVAFTVPKQTKIAPRGSKNDVIRNKRYEQRCSNSGDKRKQERISRTFNQNPARELGEILTRISAAAASSVPIGITTLSTSDGASSASEPTYASSLTAGHSICPGFCSSWRAERSAIGIECSTTPAALGWAVDLRYTSKSGSTCFGNTSCTQLSNTKIKMMGSQIRKCLLGLKTSKIKMKDLFASMLDTIQLWET